MAFSVMMRSQCITSLCFALFISLLIAVSNRRHIYNLFDVARTYSTFSSQLSSHPDILFRLESDGNTRPDIFSADPIPKIIHRILLTNQHPNTTLQSHRPALASCENLHLDWDHRLWTDDTAATFIAEHYPHLLPLYYGYADDEQRAHVLRYALLHHFGGVYLDLSLSCLARLDAPLLTNRADLALTHLPWLTAGRSPVGIDNAFILARPRHPLLDMVLAQLPRRGLHWWPSPRVERALSTGNVFLSNIWMAYIRRLSANWPRGANPSDRVYILADRFGQREQHILRPDTRTPLFLRTSSATAGGTDSRSVWDAASLLRMARYSGYLTILFGFGVVGYGSLRERRRTRQAAAANRRAKKPPRSSPKRHSISGVIARLSSDRRSMERRLGIFVDDEEQLLEKGS